MQIKFSHLDIGGRPVIVLEKTNVVPEHNQNFQVIFVLSFTVWFLSEVFDHMRKVSCKQNQKLTPVEEVNYCNCLYKGIIWKIELKKKCVEQLKTHGYSFRYQT